jgi:radical SAM protein with 4Fe4S-binding SPASM domain
MADHACRYLWEKMYVWFDGTCNPCDTDYKSYLSPGTLKFSTVEEVWHSKGYEELRAAHTDGRRSTYNPCNRCGV